MKAICALTVAASMAISTAAMAQQNPAVRVDNLQAVAGDAAPITYIIGTATNTTDKSIGAVFVDFNLYDKQNTLVGNAKSGVNNLGPGGTWQFKAGVTVPYDHFTLSKVTTY
jgi:hypothetical protein